MEIGKKYYSKVMLFGEYAIMHGSQALAIPYDDFYGTLEFNERSGEAAIRSNRALSGLVKFLLTKRTMGKVIDLDRLRNDVLNGLYFKSNIPYGYGLGSSGALVAALYNAYGDPESGLAIGDIRTHLATLEAYFHGSSSGLDPLVSYLHRPIYVKSSTDYAAVELGNVSRGRFIVFLVDTGFPRQTAQLVKKYLAKYEERVFRTIVQEHIIPINNLAIECMLLGDRGVLPMVKQLSILQMRHFKPMIEVMLTEWLHGIKSDQYYLKLCGAGGGGFILGFAISEQNIINTFMDYRVIYRASAG